MKLRMILNLMPYERRDARLISTIMKNKARFGLGIDSKNLKKGSMKKK